MTPKIITKRLPRLEKRTGIQITATIRPDLSPHSNPPMLKRKIERLINGGTSHFRLNLSHFTPEDKDAREGLTRSAYESRWRQLVRAIDAVGKRLGVNVFIMLDTAGPEFRVTRVAKGRTLIKRLEAGKKYLLSADGSSTSSQEPTLYLSMPDGFSSFGRNVRGEGINFKDGDCTAKVIEQIRPRLLKIKVLHSLTLQKKVNIKANFPGFNLEGIHSVSSDDRRHLEFFLRIPSDRVFTRKPATKKRKPAVKRNQFVEIHYVAQSFVRAAEDVADLSANLRSIYGVKRMPLIIPKIETKQAVNPETLKRIVKDTKTAAVMVARGDLGSEFNRWEVASKQRQIIRISHSFLKPVLVATEIYGSMGKYPNEAWQPNRGEVLDLRHALEAGVDGIVFSTETGGRNDPETTVEFAVRQAQVDETDIEESDMHKDERNKRRERMEFGYDCLLNRPPRTSTPEDPIPLETAPDFSTMDWACAAVYRANIRRAVGVFPFTVKGNTVRDMVHFLPHRPIVAMVDNHETLPRLALFAHVYPILVQRVPDDFDVAELKELVMAVIKKFEMSGLGTEAFATMPHPIKEASGTDTLVRILCNVD